MNLATAISRSKNKILILTFLLTANTFMYRANAQFISSEWINISNQAGDDMYPDIFKAKDGSLHCVWVLKHSNEYQEIYYSKSTDKGETWSIPENITNRDSFVFNDPHIVVDSQNRIFVTADTSMYEAGVGLITNTGSGWSNITYLTNNGYYSKLLIDNADRIYSFWQTYSYGYKYRYFENNVWSEIIQPYSQHSTFLNFVADSKNNIHILGHTDNMYAYFKYNKAADVWRDYQIISENLIEGSDICLDADENPHFVWHEYYTWPHDATLYRYSNGISFSPPETIVEDPNLQKIVWFNNQIYILDTEKEDDHYKVVLYSKDSHNNWWGTIIAHIPGWCGPIKIDILDNHNLYILWNCKEDGIQIDVYFQKLELKSSNISEFTESPLILYQNYPNPLKEQTTFKYATSIKGHCRLQILDLHGRTLAVPLNKEQSPGTYTLQWNACDASGNRLPAGTYYYRFTIDNLYTMTKSLIINE